MIATNLILVILAIAAVAAVCLAGFRAAQQEPARIVEELHFEEDERRAA
jgi:hypothetical protein